MAADRRKASRLLHRWETHDRSGRLSVRARGRSLTGGIELPLLALWIALASALAAVTSHVVDWYVMTDELLYERLAISIAHDHSPLPHVHGALVANISQLYPLLIAPFFGDGDVQSSIHSAHILNAFVMSSAAIPAFLLARSLTSKRSAGYFAAFFTVCTPWIVLSSFLLTEIPAYPAFLWAVLAIQHALTHPRLRNDLLAAGAIALAVFARTQLLVLVLVFPLALLAYELVRASAPPRSSVPALVSRATRVAIGRHQLLAATYASIALAVVSLLAVGRLASVLGVYSAAGQGGIVPRGIAGAFAELLAAIAISLAIIPFLVAVAWLCVACVKPRAPEQNAFAAIALIALIAMTAEVASFNLRFGAGGAHDRYILYLVPLVLIALCAALFDKHWPRWSLVLPTAVIAAGFARYPLRVNEKLNIDTPISVLNGRLLDLLGSARSAHVVLAIGAVVAAILFVEAAILLRRRIIAVALGTLVCISLPLATGAAVKKLFSTDGTSGRPISVEQGIVFGWIDGTLGEAGRATIIPYPMLYGDYWASVSYWWDLEFWNEKVVHSVTVDGDYAWTPSSFPKTALRLDSESGRASVTGDQYVAQSTMDVRFRLAGKIIANTRGVDLREAARPWRAEWITLGLSDDGWTRPGKPALVRVFARPGQTSSETRYLTLSLRAPSNIRERPFQIVAGETRYAGVGSESDVSTQVALCVPAHGSADIRVTTPESSALFGDPSSAAKYQLPRRGGIRITALAIADELGPACEPPPT